MSDLKITDPEHPAFNKDRPAAKPKTKATREVGIKKRAEKRAKRAKA